MDVGAHCSGGQTKGGADCGHGLTCKCLSRCDECGIRVRLRVSRCDECGLRVRLAMEHWL